MKAKIFLLPWLFALFLPPAPLAFGQTNDSPEQTAAIGQTLMVGFVGKSSADRGVQRLCANLASGRVGGVIFYGRNINSHDQTLRLVQHLKACGGLYQPIIAIDQEGGLVDRLGYGRFANSTRRFYASSFETLGNGAYASRYNQMLETVHRLGFDVNFAPVADIDRNPNNPIVGRLGRAYGTTANEVNVLLPWLIEAHNQRELSTSLKHFPGHGSSTTDSHKSFTDVTNSWSVQELAPFQLVTQDQANFPQTSIMVGHLVHRDLDPSGTPASLSSVIIGDLLRDQMGFQGAVVSDDMAMKAIADHYGWQDAAKRAMLAGVDMVIMANGSEDRIADYHTAVQALLQSEEGLMVDLTGKQRRLDLWVNRLFPIPTVRPQPDDL